MFGLVNSEMKAVSRVSGKHTDEVPTKVQSALLLPRESNAPDTPIFLQILVAGNPHQLLPVVEQDNWQSPTTASQECPQRCRFQ